MEILGDNETSFTLTNDLESKNPTKHINIIYHYVRGLVEDRELGIE